MPEEVDIDVLAQRIHRKAEEVNSSFLTVFNLLPSLTKMRFGHSDALVGISVETGEEDWLKSNAGTGMALEQYLYRYRMVLSFGRHNVVFHNALPVMHINIQAINSSWYPLPDNNTSRLFKNLLDKVSDPAGIAEQVLMLLEKLLNLFWRLGRAWSLGTYAPNFPCKEDIFSIMEKAVALSAERDVAIAERHTIASERDALLKELLELKRKVNEAAGEIAATKGMSKSKTLKGIREGLEEASEEVSKRLRALRARSSDIDRQITVWDYVGDPDPTAGGPRLRHVRQDPPIGYSDGPGPPPPNPRPLPPDYVEKGRPPTPPVEDGGDEPERH